MIDRIISFSLRYRFLILLAVTAGIGMGLFSATRLPLDALADITSLQIAINTSVTAMAPEEVEKQITVPLERVMAGLPGLQWMRSLSKFGLSQITLVFDDDRDVYQQRQLINERLQIVSAQLPPGVQPIMQPVSSGLGEIFYYGVDYKTGTSQTSTDRYQQLMNLKSVQDWVIAPLLKTVPGIAEISASGGFEKQILVQPDPSKLSNVGSSLEELASVVRGNTTNGGGGVFQRGGQQVVIRSIGRVQTLDDIRNLPLRYTSGTKPVLVKDVADVFIGSSARFGAAMENGEEAVIGGVIMLRGENTRLVAQRIRAKLQEIQADLPPDIQIHPLYDRGELVNRTLRTVQKNLFEGALLVLIILFAFLGNWRAALIVTSAIPLSLLFMITGMVQTRIVGNLMSLGAIDFGLIVDGAVVMTESIIRHFGIERKKLGRPLILTERLSTMISACQEVSKPMVFGVAIITLVYIPIFALTGIEGKMFKPMASTVMMALVSAMVLALTLIPVLCLYGLTGKLEEKETPLVQHLRQIYQRVLPWALQHTGALISLSLFLIVTSLFILSRLGAEFVPTLDEGSSLAAFVRTSSIGLDASLSLQSKSEKLLREKFPEIQNIFSRVGTDDKAVDPVGLDRSDTYIRFTPPACWRKIDGHRLNKDELTDLMSKELLENVPGQSVAFSQPIEDRFNDFLEGARADVTIKIFGDDFEILEKLARQTRMALQTVPGAADVLFEAFGKTPILEIKPNRIALSKYNLQADDINRVVSLGLGGDKLGIVIEGDRFINLILRLPENSRQDPNKLRYLPVRLSDGGFIPLGQIAEFNIADKVNEIHRDSGHRRTSVLVNIRGRDLASFVHEAQQKIKSAVQLPEGYRIEFGGQFKNLESARARLWIVVPITLGLIFCLIYWAFGSWRHTLLIYTGIPLAATGGVFALALRELPFSISAAIGFIALSGVAVLNGIVLISYFNKLRAANKNVREVVIEGSLTRLRPVLTTALVASFGFIPMAIARGVGAEVQRPLATVVIGGILSSTFLTLVLLPALYLKLEQKKSLS